MLKDEKVFILGMARSGYEAAKLIAKENQILITDMKEQDKENVKELEKLNVKVIITDNPIDLLDETYTLLIKNPGIKYDNPIVQKAKKLNIPVINEVELAFKYMKPNVNIIGVTGSNGKTTTVTLIYNILKEHFNNVHLCGNIGVPLSNKIKDINSNDYLVLEISDHQLCDMYDFKTNISVLNNIYEAHTDFHDSHEKYKQTKKKIFNNHTKKDIAIINYDNKEAYELTKDISSTIKYFSKDTKQNVYLLNNSIYYQDEKVIDCQDIKLKGLHNYENIMAAISVVKEYNVPNEAIIKVLKDFKGVEHRIEYVNTINNVAYYNDSKSTNCESTITALKSFTEPILLIMGGLDRKHSFEDLTPYINIVKYVACYGETKNRIQEYFTKQNIPCTIFNNLIEATESCYKKALPNEIVLLSPACASWDQYEKFEDRGDEFKNYINSLKEK